MKLGDLLFRVFAVIVALVVNWVLISTGADYLSKPNSIYNWIGTAFIIVAILILATALYYLIQELRKL